MHTFKGPFWPLRSSRGCTANTQCAYFNYVIFSLDNVHAVVRNGSAEKTVCLRTMTAMLQGKESSKKSRGEGEKATDPVPTVATDEDG